MHTFFICLNLLIFASSYILAFRLSIPKRFSERIITTFLLYFSQISFFVLFCGVVLQDLGYYPLSLFNALTSAVVLVIFRKSIPEAATDFWQHCRRAFSKLIKARDFFLYAILFLFFIQVIWILIKIYFLPPHVWDVFAYHIHPAVEWLQNNMIMDYIDTPVFRLNRNPMGLKLFYIWIAKFWGDITWLEFPQFLFGIISMLSAYALMLKMKIKKLSALKYAVLIYFIPLIVIESRTCQDHLALMGIILMATLYFINSFYLKETTQLAFLGLSFGLLLGVKISGLHVLIIFFVAILVSKGFSYSAILAYFKPEKSLNRKGQNGFIAAQIVPFVHSTFFPLLVGILSAILLGGYWYVRNISILRAYWVNLTGVISVKNIIAAIFALVAVIVMRTVFKKKKTRHFLKNKSVIVVSIVILILLLGTLLIQNYELIKTFVLGYNTPMHVFKDPNFIKEHPVLKSLDSKFVRNLLSFPYRIKDMGLYMGYTPDFLESSGFGVQFFSFGLVAYLIMTFFIFRKKYRVGIPGFIYIFSFLLLGTYFFYYFSSANYRLFMFFPVFGIMLWAFLLNEFDLKRLYLIIIDLLIIGMILFNMFATVFDGNANKNRWKNTLTLSTSDERTSIKYSPFFKGDDWFYIDNYIDNDEPIGYLGHIDSWISPYFDNRIQRRIYHLKSVENFKLKKGKNGEIVLQFNDSFVSGLKRRGIHYLHINPQGSRHFRKYLKPIFITDKRVLRVTNNLYYLEW